MRSRTPTAIALLTFVWVTGCGPSAAPRRAAPVPADEDFNAVWNAAIEVLRQYRFAIDRLDRRNKLITTLPMVGRYWFEFWRADAATPRDVLEGSLHTIYRRVAVAIHRAEPGTETMPVMGSYLAEVEVRVSRSDRPAAHVTSTSDAYDMFLDPGRMLRPAGDGEAGEAAEQVRVELGRDENLEKILRRRINSLAAKKLTIYPRQ